VVAASFWFARAKRRCKTTTIGVLTTRVRPRAALQRIGGRCYERSGCGQTSDRVCTQVNNLDRSLTARENLLFHAEYFGVRNEREKHANELLEISAAGRATKRRSDFRRYGTATEIARALMHTPSICSGEPTMVWIHNRAARCGICSRNCTQKV